MHLIFRSVWCFYFAVGFHLRTDRTPCFSTENLVLLDGNMCLYESVKVWVSFWNILSCYVISHFNIIGQELYLFRSDRSRRDLLWLHECKCTSFLEQKFLGGLNTLSIYSCFKLPNTIRAYRLWYLKSQALDSLYYSLCYNPKRPLVSTENPGQTFIYFQKVCLEIEEA